MRSRVPLAATAVLLGAWMAFDGAHVLRHGAYFGPEVPGPWRHPVRALGLDPFGIGPVFVALGLGWLLAALALLARGSQAPLAAAAILSSWYLPVGTLIAADGLRRA